MAKKIKTGPVSGTTLSLNVDSVSRVMEFSRVMERRNLSCVSSIYKEAFDASRDTCTKIVMNKIVEERQEKMYFYTIYHADETLGDVLPRTFDKSQLTGYVQYQIDGIFNRNYKEGMDANQFYDIVDESFHLTDIFKIGTILGLMEGLSRTEYEDMTIREFFLRDFGMECECVIDRIKTLEYKRDILFYTDVIVDKCGKTLLTSFQIKSWEKRVGKA